MNAGADECEDILQEVFVPRAFGLCMVPANTMLYVCSASETDDPLHNVCVDFCADPLYAIERFREANFGVQRTMLHAYKNLTHLRLVNMDMMGYAYSYPDHMLNDYIGAAGRKQRRERVGQIIHFAAALQSVDPLRRLDQLINIKWTLEDVFAEIRENFPECEGALLSRDVRLPRTAHVMTSWLKLEKCAAIPVDYRGMIDKVVGWAPDFYQPCDPTDVLALEWFNKYDDVAQYELLADSAWRPLRNLQAEIAQFLHEEAKKQSPLDWERTAQLRQTFVRKSNECERKATNSAQPILPLCALPGGIRA